MPITSIAFISPRFAEGPTVGGAETLLKTQARYAASHDMDTTFLATCARNHFTWENEIEPGQREIDGLKVHFFPVDESRDVDSFMHVQQRISRGKPVTREEEDTWIRNSVNSQALCDHLGESAERYDRIVIGPYLFGLCHQASRIFPDRTVLVPCLHDEPFAGLEVTRELFDRSRTVMFNSPAERQLATRLYGDRYNAMPVVGMGLEAFKADPLKFARSHQLNSPYLLYSGRREPLKGTPLLLDYVEAFRARTQRDLKLVLTGTGPIETPPALAPHLIDLGFVTEQEKREVMAGALAFCHPSVNESFGIVALEAWLAGTPLLVHAGGAVLRELCRESNGGLWFKTYGEFEESLIGLLDHPEFRTALGSSGQSYVLDHYQPDSVSARMLEALQR